MQRMSPEMSFRQKKGEFESYRERTNIKGEEIANDLYRSCETPLKRKLITSSKIKEDIKSTDPKVMMDEIKRLCLPRVNIIVEREQFHKLEQGEDKKLRTTREDFDRKVTSLSGNMVRLEVQGQSSSF